MRLDNEKPTAFRDVWKLETVDAQPASLFSVVQIRSQTTTRLTACLLCVGTQTTRLALYFSLATEVTVRFASKKCFDAKFGQKG